MTPKIGDRRPREGRCPRCDRPLRDLVYETFRPIAFTGPLKWTQGDPVSDWVPDDRQPGRCDGEDHCAGPSVDWRARALAAEAALQTVRDVLDDPNGFSLAIDDGTIGGEVAAERHHWLSLVMSERDAAFLDGAQHGLLAAAWGLDTDCRCGPEWTQYRRHHPGCQSWVAECIAEMSAAAKGGSNG